MTTPSEPTELEYPEYPRSASARGRLMAVDWANGTARLDMPQGDSVMLRFSVSDIEIENRFRKLATCHVDVLGYRLASGENGKCEAINVEEISHSRLESEQPKEPKEGPVSEEEWDEFMRAIHEGRDGLCGECRRRGPVA